jgi:lysyl-tRNA synthetase class 1
MAGGDQGDWVVGAADLVVEQQRDRPGEVVVCASGISPSGPIHLGNLREIMVPHLVAEEVRARGVECRHILSWDDYDRLRKVPAGLPESYAEHIGRPLTSVPDPCGEHANWAEHFKEPFRAALAALGVDVVEISQTERYTSGAYTQQVLHALNHRQEIDAVLGRYRTAKAAATTVEGPTDEDAAEAAAEGDTSATGQDYYPYKPYCAQCGRDTTTVTYFGGADQRGSVGGADQRRSVGGADQRGSFGGADQRRSVGGADQRRSVGGADQRSSVGGADQRRSVGGADQRGSFGGADQQGAYQQGADQRGSIDPATSRLDYVCACGHTESIDLNTEHHGKLVWKVDWPMRWAYEGVSFEAGGVDHSSPGSSFVVGSQLVREVFGGQPPAYLAYSFVGTSGMAKMSGSAGGAPTPTDALRILEAPLLRWLYARRRPNQSFTVAFDQEVGRIYDEWDALAGRAAADRAESREALAYQRSVRTSLGPLPQTPRPFPFRTLSSIVDITAGDQHQILRILADMDPAIASLDEVQPRLTLAGAWVSTYLAAEDRTQVRTEPDRDRLDALDATQREALKLVLESLTADWSVAGLTALVYGVPKVQLGLPLDTKPTPELKVRQREFFALLYLLLVGRDTGPRLPTLLLALGPHRIRALLASEE